MPYAACLFIVYAALSVTNVLAAGFKNARVSALTTPLLMPVLTAAYLLGAGRPWQIAAALLCGFLGDVLLMGPRSFFLPGLLAFLVGHLFYAAAFLGSVSFPAVPLPFYLCLLPYIAFGIAIYRILLPNLQNLKIPCQVYMYGILLMSFSSLLRFWTVTGPQFWLPFTGSLLFIASDAMLVLQFFSPRKKGGNAAGMATYLLAQGFIAGGFMLSP